MGESIELCMRAVPGTMPRRRLPARVRRLRPVKWRRLPPTRRRERMPTLGAAAPGNLPVPEGATRAMVALGDRIYHGQVGGAACAGCHGAHATGSPLGPDLTSKKWLWSDGSYAGIANTIKDRSAAPQRISQPDATHGRGATHSRPALGARRICLGTEPLMDESCEEPLDREASWNARWHRDHK